MPSEPAVLLQLREPNSPTARRTWLRLSASAGQAPALLVEVGARGQTCQIRLNTTQVAELRRALDEYEHAEAQGASRPDSGAAAILRGARELAGEAAARAQRAEEERDARRAAAVQAYVDERAATFSRELARILGARADRSPFTGLTWNLLASADEQISFDDNDRLVLPGPAYSLPLLARFDRVGVIGVVDQAANAYTFSLATSAKGVSRAKFTSREELGQAVTHAMHWDLLDVSYYAPEGREGY
ncbi:hypothetical protein ACLQ3K_24640 [Tsukamurella sp. DT100]|uniref:hypothetical protein n=1 Tax=Tsukamurella sp. DT100 TaxID=3393415 RepID=UPI003CF6D4A5